ncbi:MAG: SxtJ family membrane protein [Bacteroidota bacterium]|nr:SxtJ family membrane protein [Bacteroidota bacterium]
MRASQIDTSRRNLRSFGLLVGLITALIGGWLLWKGHGFMLLGAGLLLILLGFALPKWLKPLYVPWMALAFVLGFVMTRVLLTLLFYAVMTPIGIVMRWTGRDPLRRKIDRSAKTYWIPKAPTEDLTKHLQRYY